MAGTMGCVSCQGFAGVPRLNGVRPRWPEQCAPQRLQLSWGTPGLNGVRPRWPEQWGCTRTSGSTITSLNGVRPRWPEQFRAWSRGGPPDSLNVSMESGLDGRNNPEKNPNQPPAGGKVSMESGLDGRNNHNKHVQNLQKRFESQWSPA